MTCRELITFLMQYLAGELPPPEHTEFDRHLGDCQACRAYLATYQETIRMEQRAFTDDDQPVPESVPEDLVEAILVARRK